MSRRLAFRAVGRAAALVVGLGLCAGAVTYDRFRPVAMTLGPATTVYFREPTLATRVHEAIHRRQMREKSLVGRLATVLRYPFDYSFRLDEEAEAKAGEICLQAHRFSSVLPAYTTARSRAQAEAYRAWAWERIDPRVPDRVGDQLGDGRRCADILRGVVLDLPPGHPLEDGEALKLAAFRFLQAYGSGGDDVALWKARVALAGWAAPARWTLPVDVPDFGILPAARAQAAAVDPAVTPMDAGQALHRLTYATAQRMYTQLQAPLAGYRGSRALDPEAAERATGVPLEDWSRVLVARALAGPLDDRTVELLERVDRHPANADLEAFARAAEADIVGTRYVLPLRVGWSRIVPSELEPLREAVRAQYGRAALAIDRGDDRAAEARLRIALGAALQLVRSGPFELDVVEGLRLAGEALDALEGFLVARGRGDEVTWAAARSGARPVPAHRAALFAGDPAALFRSLPAIARDPDVPHAFRRFAYRQVALYDVCLARREDAHARLWHREWTDAVVAGLARSASEAELVGALRRTVEALFERSAVPPDQVCAPVTGVRPQAQVAIMSAPPRWAAAVAGPSLQ